MANDDKKRSSEEDFATNPSVNPETGEVNPSAPTAGTEGWGTTPDERRALNPNPPVRNSGGTDERRTWRRQGEIPKTILNEPIKKARMPGHLALQLFVRTIVRACFRPLFLR